MYADVASPLDEAANVSSISQSIMCFTSPCPLASWHAEDFLGHCAYVRTLHDQAVPYDIQDAMLRGTGQEWVVCDIATGHSPQLAAPEALTDIILQMAQQIGALPQGVSSKSSRISNCFAWLFATVRGSRQMEKRCGKAERLMAGK